MNVALSPFQSCSVVDLDLWSPSEGMILPYQWIIRLFLNCSLFFMHAYTIDTFFVPSHSLIVLSRTFSTAAVCLVIGGKAQVSLISFPMTPISVSVLVNYDSPLSTKARYQDHEPELIHPGAFPSMQNQNVFNEETPIWYGAYISHSDNTMMLFFPSVWFIFRQKTHVLEAPCFCPPTFCYCFTKV